MEKFIRYSLPPFRRFGSPLQVIKSGYMEAKDYVVDTTFDTVSFSFITRGEGTLKMNNKKYLLKSPVVCMQHPGVHMVYGPEEGETWDELFITYDVKVIPYLESRNFIKGKRFMWPIQNLGACLMMLKQIKEFLHREQLFYLERFDMLCESLILESLLPEPQAGGTKGERIVKEICAEINTLNKGFVDLTYYTQKFNVSLPTIRRYWNECIGIPPGQYLAEKIMQSACYYLSETDDTIKTIAERLHFQDQLYFSKKFRKATKMSPTEYRKKHAKRYG